MKCTNEMMCVLVVTLLAVLVYGMTPRNQRVLRAPGGSCMAAMQSMVGINTGSAQNKKKVGAMTTTSIQSTKLDGLCGGNRTGAVTLVSGRPIARTQGCTAQNAETVTAGHVDI